MKATWSKTAQSLEVPSVVALGAEDNLGRPNSPKGTFKAPPHTSTAIAEALRTTQNPTTTSPHHHQPNFQAMPAASDEEMLNHESATDHRLPSPPIFAPGDVITVDAKTMSDAACPDATLATSITGFPPASTDQHCPSIVVSVHPGDIQPSTDAPPRVESGTTTTCDTGALEVTTSDPPASLDPHVDTLGTETQSPQPAASQQLPEGSPPGHSSVPVALAPKTVSEDSAAIHQEAASEHAKSIAGLPGLNKTNSSAKSILSTSSDLHSGDESEDRISDLEDDMGDDGMDGTASLHSKDSGDQGGDQGGTNDSDPTGVAGRKDKKQSKKRCMARSKEDKESAQLRKKVPRVQLGVMPDSDFVLSRMPGSGEKGSPAFYWRRGRKTKLGRRVNDVQLQEVEKYFHLPLEEAATAARIGVTLFKNVCRKLGINRWPYRKLCRLKWLYGKIQADQGNMQDYKDLAEIMESLDLLPDSCVWDNAGVNFEWLTAQKRTMEMLMSIKPEDMQHISEQQQLLRSTQPLEDPSAAQIITLPLPALPTSVAPPAVSSSPVLPPTNPPPPPPQLPATDPPPSLVLPTNPPPSLVLPTNQPPSPQHAPEPQAKLLPIDNKDEVIRILSNIVQSHLPHLLPNSLAAVVSQTGTGAATGGSSPGAVQEAAGSCPAAAALQPSGGGSQALLASQLGTNQMEQTLLSVLSAAMEGHQTSVAEPAPQQGLHPASPMHFQPHTLPPTHAANPFHALTTQSLIPPPHCSVPSPRARSHDYPSLLSDRTSLPPAVLSILDSVQASRAALSSSNPPLPPGHSPNLLLPTLPQPTYNHMGADSSLGLHPAIDNLLACCTNPLDRRTVLTVLQAHLNKSSHARGGPSGAPAGDPTGGTPGGYPISSPVQSPLSLNTLLMLQHQQRQRQEHVRSIQQNQLLSAGRQQLRRATSGLTGSSGSSGAEGQGLHPVVNNLLGRNEQSGNPTVSRQDSAKVQELLFLARNGYGQQ